MSHEVVQQNAPKISQIELLQIHISKYVYFFTMKYDGL